MLQELRNLRQYLLSGVSFAIPFIACGGILIAATVAFAPMTAAGPDVSRSATLKLLLDVGGAAFMLMPAVLGGYIAYAMAGKPGLVPGFVGAWLSTHLGTVVTATGTHDASAGFLGAILAGLLAGYSVLFFKKLGVPAFIRPIMPILIIPIVCSVLVSVVMLKVVGWPIAHVMAAMSDWLKVMGAGNAIVLAAILGAMIAVDMGGPINKTAFFFGAAMINEGNCTIMGAIAAAICTPPLGLGLATLIRRARWSSEEREAGAAALAMGLMGITEGAIPFAAADPIRVIPCIVVGSMVASTCAMLSGVGDHAPHGGPIVLPVVDHRLMYIVAIVVGSVVTAAAIHSVKSVFPTQTPEQK